MHKTSATSSDASRLVVSTVNYRTPEITIQCLASLAPEIAAMEDARVVVVDNASGDDSVSRISEAIEANGWSWCDLVASTSNQGYAGGINRGLEAGGPCDYALVLNNDTIIHPGTIAACIQTMKQEATVGAMSCRLLHDEEGVQSVGRRFPSPARVIVSSLGLPWRLPALFGWADTEDPRWDRATTRREVDWIGGAFMLVRGEIIESLGGMDESFFFYGEDVEWCHRMKRAGWTCLYDPTHAITHLGAMSSSSEKFDPRRRRAQSYHARYMIQEKCYGRLASGVLRATDITMQALRVLKLRVTGRPSDEAYSTAREDLDLLRHGLRGGARGFAPTEGHPSSS